MCGICFFVQAFPEVYRPFSLLRKNTLYKAFVCDSLIIIVLTQRKKGRQKWQTRPQSALHTRRVEGGLTRYMNGFGKLVKSC